MITSTSARLRKRRYSLTKYPTCWKRVSRVIRALANGHCERCGKACDCLEVHHIGADYIGRAGNPHDKHDIRRENLTAICFTCHDELEHVGKIRKKQKTRKQRRRAMLEAHRALGIGTGLVVWEGSAAA